MINVVFSLVLVVAFAACGPMRSLSSQPEAQWFAVGDAVVVPETLDVLTVSRVRIASGLNNPRGMLVTDDDALLVAVAGTGDPEDSANGALLELVDENGDGDFDDSGERIVIIGNQSSLNILDIVQRDEVFGMAAVQRGGGTIVASHALFQGGSTLFRIAEGRGKQWSRVHGNVNDLAYRTASDQWFAVSSSSDEVIRLTSAGEGVRILKFPPLAEGQDSVPGYLEVEPHSGDILVSLFSGSPLGESAGTGVELRKRAGAIARIDPEDSGISWVVTGLTAPTDLALDESGRLYVLELCDDFLDPVSDYDSLRTHVGHGGFRRFSGRLLRIDPSTSAVEVIARGLDTPTNITLSGNRAYIAQGMGTPGRQVPSGDGSVAIDGFIEVVVLPD